MQISLVEKILLGLLGMSAVAWSLTAYANTKAEATKAPSSIEAASGKGTYPHDQRVVARIVLCSGAMSAGLDKEKLNEWMAAHGFDKDNAERTMDVCVAFATGVTLSEQQPDNSETTPDHNGETI